MAEQAILFSARAPYSEPAVVNGAAGLVVKRNGRLLTVMGFTVVKDRIVAIDILADTERLERLEAHPVRGRRDDLRASRPDPRDA